MTTKPSEDANQLPDLVKRQRPSRRRRTIVTPPDKFDRNRGTGRANAAVINRPDGPPFPGVYIHQHTSGAWMVMPEDHAIRLANRIIDVIEARRAKEETA